MAFWKKIFKSKYTGKEIDAAIAKAGTVPTVTSADAGKALVVDDEGKIVAGEASGGGGSFVDNSWLIGAEEDTEIGVNFIKNFTNEAELNAYIEQIAGYYASGKRIVIIASVFMSNSPSFVVNDKYAAEIAGYEDIDSMGAPIMSTGIFHFNGAAFYSHVDKETESEEPYIALSFSIPK